MTVSLVLWYYPFIAGQTWAFQCTTLTDVYKRNGKRCVYYVIGFAGAFRPIPELVNKMEVKQILYDSVG